jgi:imidazolonepropionase-like amidohydrolase
MWRVADEGFRADPRLKYLPRGLRDRFESFGKEPRSGDDVELWRRYYEIHSASVGHMRDAGVQLLAGTDGGEPYSFPAFGLHDELRLLVDAGLSPLAALQTATLNPARFFGREQDLGTIDEGKVADLVLLDASPLTAIGNTTKVNAVVANGRLFRRADLDELLAQAERAAKE